jgi:micrococcal nuclease
MRFPAIILILNLLVGPAARAVDGPDIRAALAPGESARVTAVVDGDTVMLDTGRKVRLVGIQAPKLPLGRPNFQAWPLADDAKAALEELTLGRTVTLGYGGQRMDRHGRLLAHLFTADGTWVQGRLLADGLARVYSFADNRALVARMLAVEIQARADGTGIWSHPFYAVLDDAASGAHLDQFALVEGRVTDVAVARGRTYLNFGADWRTDFTVSVSSRDWRSFAAAGIDPSDYRDRRIRVRGWLKSHNGPMSDVTHPEQIETLPR